MSHVLDPDHLVTDTHYSAALDELEELMLSDADTPAGRRFDELVALIEDYEARTWPAELPPRTGVRQPAVTYGMR